MNGPAHHRTPPLLLLLPLLLAGCGPARPAAPSTPQSALAPALGVDLSAMQRTASGLYIETLRPGRGAMAGPGSTVRVHYEGWLASGTRFDSSRERGAPLEFVLGQAPVIEGWEEGVTGMVEGELRRLVVPPSLGYGRQGSPGTVPPDATLVFEIELLSVDAADR